MRQWEDLAPVAFLAGAAAALPSFIDKENGAGKAMQGQGKRQRPKHELHRQHQSAP
jgi:hypothetical protein